MPLGVGGRERERTLQKLREIARRQAPDALQCGFACTQQRTHHVAQRRICVVSVVHVRQHDEDPRPRHLPHEEVQQLERRGIALVCIVKQQQQRLAHGEPREELRDVP